MSWLIGIICVVIVIYFWRIFLPIILLLSVGIGIYYIIDEKEKEDRISAKEEAEFELRLKIENAKKTATSEGKEWIVYGERDPASDILIARTASIQSNDGLCYLSVQKRINGSELTGLRCQGIKISEFSDINVKFDIFETSKKMDLKTYSDSKDVYIPSDQSTYSGKLPYANFIKGLVTAKSVAIEIPGTISFWVRFTLKGSTVAINQLGKKLRSTEKVN